MVLLDLLPTKEAVGRVRKCGKSHRKIRVETKDICAMFAIIRYVAPTICGGSLLEGKRYKRRGQKNIHNKAIQTKIRLYINKYIVKNITNIQKYSLSNILSYAC